MKLTKINVLVSGGLFFFGFLALIYFHEQNLICGIAWDCYDLMLNFSYILLGLAIAVLPFSLLTFPLPSLVFDAWKRFSLWAIPVMVLLALIVIFSLDASGGGIGSLVAGKIILYALAGLYGLYFLVSLIVIILAVFKTRKKV